jgi:hypothetical protein
MCKPKPGIKDFAQVFFRNPSAVIAIFKSKAPILLLGLLTQRLHQFSCCWIALFGILGQSP